jgi:superfamily I DNA and/or RNA helicase
VRRIHRFYGERFDVQKTVGVIVPYRIEIGRIRKEIERMGIPELRDISIDTVERYQGSQRDVIIYDFAVSDDSQLEFLTATCFEEGGTVIDRKLNVAMTRARKQLLMTGNAGILRRNKIFDALIARYTKNYS